MVTVLVRHKVEDLLRWKPVFDAASDMRRQHGEKAVRIFRDTDNTNALTLLIDFANLDEAIAFMQSNRLREEMKRAGVVGEPEVCYLTEMHFARRTAAD